MSDPIIEQSTTQNKPRNILSIDIGYHNFGYCILKDFDKTNESKNINEYLLFGIFDIDQKLKSSHRKCKTDNRMKCLLEWVDNIVKTHKISLIIVEQQVKRNVIAVILQSAVMSYGYLNNISVYVFSPRKKFSLTNQKFNTKKKEHKKIVQVWARELILHYDYDLGNVEISEDENKIESRILTEFDLMNKKDDVSDSIIMAFMLCNFKNWDESRIKLIFEGKSLKFYHQKKLESSLENSTEPDLTDLKEVLSKYLTFEIEGN